MIRWLKTQKRLRLELQLLQKDFDNLQDRHTALLGRTLTIPPAPTFKQLGDLWMEAEKMGEVEVDRNRDWQRNTGTYEVKIKFSTKKNSSIAAKGQGDTIVEALENSINEARALMAGVIFANA